MDLIGHLEVNYGIAKPLYVVLEVSQPSVAGVTKESSYSSCVMIVVDCKG